MRIYAVVWGNQAMHPLCVGLVLQHNVYHSTKDVMYASSVGLPIAVNGTNRLSSLLLALTGAPVVSQSECGATCWPPASCGTRLASASSVQESFRAKVSGAVRCNRTVQHAPVLIDRKASRRLVPAPLSAHYLELMSAHEQVCFALTHTHVVGVHGAGLTLFSLLAPREGSFLLELCPYGYAACGLYANKSRHWRYLELPRSASVPPGCLDSCTQPEYASWWQTAASWWDSCRATARSCDVAMDSVLLLLSRST